MTVSVVNGYLCFSSCDVARAETGVNPHPKSDHVNGAAEPASAVVSGGSLSQAAGSNGSAGNAGQAIAAPAVPSQSNAIDFQA